MSTTHDASMLLICPQRNPLLYPENYVWASLCGNSIIYKILCENVFRLQIFSVAFLVWFLPSATAYCKPWEHVLIFPGMAALAPQAVHCTCMAALALQAVHYCTVGPRWHSRMCTTVQYGKQEMDDFSFFDC